MYGIDFSAPLRVLLVTCCISVPLGIWKLVEIMVWLFEHVRWV